MTRFLIHKEGGRFSLRALGDFLRAADDGCYRLEATRLRRGRTPNQNGWLWGCVYPLLLDGLLDAGWEFTSVRQVHEFFKRLVAHDRVVNRHTGEIVEIPQSTAAMDTQQFSAYVEALRSYGSEFLGVTIPDPDKGWRHNARPEPARGDTPP